MPHAQTFDDQFVVPLYLDGKPKITSDRFDVKSPVTNKVCWTSSSASEADALAAVESADRAFQTWGKTKPRERRDILLRAYDILMDRYEESKKYSHTETGASDGMFDFEYRTAAELLKFTAGVISTVQGSVPEIEGDGSHAMVLKEPYGVVLAIAPWNAPHILGLRACVAPLAAGNTVVLKGPEFAPATYHNFVDALHEAGLPSGCINTIYHRPADAAKITKALIQHKAVQKVNFTGSSAVGSIVASLCGQYHKQCLMELGGKAPAIVCDDADLDLAAELCAFGAMHNSGQICMSTERIIVFETVADQFRERLRAAMEKRSEEFPDGVTVISETPAKKNKALISDALSKGATMLYGSLSEQPSSGSVLRPMIVENVDKNADIYKTEAFGPTVAMYTVKNDEEAIAMANDTEYGLTSAVYTSDLARGFRFARQIVSGAVHINQPTVHDEAVLPHGGVKSSGFGRFSGRECLDEWVRTKVVTWQE